MLCYNIHTVLKKNCYPQHLLEKVTNTFVEKYYKSTLGHNANNDNHKDDKDHSKQGYYFKLPFIGKHSYLTKSRLMRIIKTFCKDAKIIPVFTPYKIGTYFTAKDKVNNLGLVLYINLLYLILFGTFMYSVAVYIYIYIYIYQSLFS